MQVPHGMGDLTQAVAFLRDAEKEGWVKFEGEGFYHARERLAGFIARARALDEGGQTKIDADSVLDRGIAQMLSVAPQGAGMLLAVIPYHRGALRTFEFVTPGVPLTMAAWAEAGARMGADLARLRDEMGPSTS